MGMTGEWGGAGPDPGGHSHHRGHTGRRCSKDSKELLKSGVCVCRIPGGWGRGGDEQGCGGREMGRHRGHPSQKVFYLRRRLLSNERELVRRLERPSDAFPGLPLPSPGPPALPRTPPQAPNTLPWPPPASHTALSSVRQARSPPHG